MVIFFATTITWNNCNFADATNRWSLLKQLWSILFNNKKIPTISRLYTFEKKNCILPLLKKKDAYHIFGFYGFNEWTFCHIDGKFALQRIIPQPCQKFLSAIVANFKSFHSGVFILNFKCFPLYNMFKLMIMYDLNKTHSRIEFKRCDKMHSLVYWFV